MTDALWQPSTDRLNNALLSHFHARLQARHPDLEAGNYPQLHDWSVKNPQAFWSCVWDFCGVIGEKTGAVTAGAGMPGQVFFPEARLNFAENLLERGEAGDLVLRYLGEDGERIGMTRSELKSQVASVAQHFRDLGLQAGDRVAAMLPNRPEALIAMLATTSLGGVWSSCSPDFGLQGVLDRFGQIGPKIFIACGAYHYGGKRFDTREKAEQVRASIPELTAAYILADDNLPAGYTAWSELLTNPSTPIRYTRVNFNDPLYILYSSGTTGVPKCIVHGVGGTLLQHLKEHQLQADIHPGDGMFYFSTCGWMMWNWLVSGLASQATILMFDGSPFHPSPQVLFEFVEEHQASFFGISAKFIDALKSQGIVPRETHALSQLRTIASTGSPLVPESFEYIYQAIKSDVAVQSISGGTDIVACFVLGNPWQPVYSGEIQGKALGMDVDVCDEHGNSLPASEKGDLICRSPFPSMPIGFWNDPDGARYKAAYFERFPGIWHHGDYAERTAHGGIIIHGRSDATLNPGGVRIGTAELYRQVEKIPTVTEALAVGQAWEGDVRIVLFVILQTGMTLDADLEKTIRSQIRSGASPRHVPAKIVQVTDFPRTRSGKLAEIAVRDIIQGRVVKNVEALANPLSLALFSNLPELQVS